MIAIPLRVEHRMMGEHDTEVLLRDVGRGDPDAERQLWEHYRGPLKRMVHARIDPFLATCVDPSDVVQETLIDASLKLETYLRDRPLPFYPWLRCLTIERMAQLRRHHGARKRHPQGKAIVHGLADGSSVRLADLLAMKNTTLGGSLIREQLRHKLQDALETMSAKLCEVLTMHYLEQLSFTEISEATGVAEGTIKVRHFRALVRLRQLLGDDSDLGRW